ncbi:MAG TPA: cytochrome c [Candidatus Binatia bacterium]|nr:cytochrome c [Candidatus Binatia bacterium]
MRIVRPAAAALAWLAAATALCMPLFALAPADASAAELRFVRDGSTVRAIPLDALRKECGERVVTIEDPYYGKQKKFRACPLSEVVRLGFGVPAGDLAGEDVVFRASDGYAKPSSAARLAEDGGYLAFSDADLDGGGPPAWAPIDRKQVDPAPFYVVWSRPEQRDAHVHPWPYALVEIELTSLADRYPHIVPTGAPPDSPARAGYEIFKSDCLACHSVNGEGGKVGPDLNVPKSIVEYRPVEQIKQYIRDPATFRYTSMPAHDYLSDRQLADLIAYFEAMSRLKHDPGRTS